MRNSATAWTVSQTVQRTAVGCQGLKKNLGHFTAFKKGDDKKQRVRPALKF